MGILGAFDRWFDGHPKRTYQPPLGGDEFEYKGTRTYSIAHMLTTYNSIGIELPYSASQDPLGNAEVTVRFKRTADAAWRDGLPLWKVSAPSDDKGMAFYGSVLLCDPGTQYEVELTSSVLGGGGVATGVATTRSDNIPDASTLVPTRYVAITGNDAADGATPATAWRTLNQAILHAPAGSVVQIGPGLFTYPTANVSRRLTFIAEHPAVTYDPGMHTWTQTDSALRTIIYSGVYSVPNVGAWQPVIVTDPQHADNYPGSILPPPGSVNYLVWKWANFPVAPTSYVTMGYSDSLLDTPKRVANWYQGIGGEIGTGPEWAEKCYTNRTYNYGFIILPNGVGGYDAWIRLPGDDNPNNHYMVYGQGVGFFLNSPRIRLSGLDLRNVQYVILNNYTASYSVVDHCIMSGFYHGVQFNGRTSAPGYASSPTIQYNVFQDYNLWLDGAGYNDAIPWLFVKAALVNGDGTNYVKVGAANESGPIGGKYGAAIGVVARYNLSDGCHDGFPWESVITTDRYGSNNWDVYGNVIRHCQDDAFEPVGPCINARIWSNHMESGSVLLSVQGSTYGPVYFFRNTCYREGNYGVAPDLGGSRGVGPYMIKFDNSSTPRSKLFFVHNTQWTDRGGADGSYQVNGGTQTHADGTGCPAFYFRNNLVRLTGYVFRIVADIAPLGLLDEDYNYWETVDNTKGFKYGALGVIYQTVPAYGAVTGQGSHSNVLIYVAAPPYSGIYDDFITPAAIDNKLAAAASGGAYPVLVGPPVGIIDAGVSLPNISDLPGINYLGAAPDKGAIESGMLLKPDGSMVPIQIGLIARPPHWGR